MQNAPRRQRQQHGHWEPRFLFRGAALSMPSPTLLNIPSYSGAIRRDRLLVLPTLSGPLIFVRGGGGGDTIIISRGLWNRSLCMV